MKRLFGFALLALMVTVSVAHADDDRTDPSQVDNPSACNEDSQLVQEASSLRQMAQEDLQTLQMKVQNSSASSLRLQLHQAEIRVVQMQANEQAIMEKQAEDCAH